MQMHMICVQQLANNNMSRVSAPDSPSRCGGTQHLLCSSIRAHTRRVMHIFAYKLITSRRQTLWRSKRKKERAKKASQCVKLSASARNRKIRSCAIACARGVTFHKSHSHTHTNKLIYARTIKCNALRGMHSEKNTRKFCNNFTFECTVGKKNQQKTFLAEFGKWHFLFLVLV